MFLKSQLKYQNYVLKSTVSLDLVKCFIPSTTFVQSRIQDQNVLKISREITPGLKKISTTSMSPRGVGVEQ